jgi:phosphoglycolate phosphatase
MTTYKAIIFDLDGTLLDTLEDIGDAMNRVLKKRGFPVHDMDAYRHFIGDGAEMLTQRALPETHRSQETVYACLGDFKHDYGENWDQKTKAYPGVPEMLDRLTAIDVRMAVFSNKPHEFAIQCVERLLADWKFQKIIGLSHRLPRKPDPAGALAVAADFKLDPAHFLYLGDSAVDMKTAVTAGMYPVGAAWGFRTEKELMENGCRFLAKHPMDILSLL